MISIITDTTSVLSDEIAKKYEIPVISQIITFGEDSFYEGTEIDIETFMSRLRTEKQLPKTAAPPPELFSSEFKRLLPASETIFCIHPSSEVSGTVRSASVAAKDFPDADIRVIDTRTIGSPLGSMVQIAAQMAASGTDADTIEARLNNMIPRCRLYFLVDTLEYLAKGGRIGGASALLGSVLRIKPILTFRDGHVDQYERERTHRRALERLIEIVLEQIPRRAESYLTVMHADVPDQGDSLAEDFANELQIASVPTFNVPPAIITHGGPGILAAAFFI
jgi:DegV family protein with EDD domain